MNLENLESFLIEKSKINKEFIRDFFGFQKKTLYESYNPFTIDLDDIAFWLEIDKNKIKKTLVNNYDNKIDYIIVNFIIDYTSLNIY